MLGHPTSAIPTYTGDITMSRIADSRYVLLNHTDSLESILYYTRRDFEKHFENLAKPLQTAFYKKTLLLDGVATFTFKENSVTVAGDNSPQATPVWTFVGQQNNGDVWRIYVFPMVQIQPEHGNEINSNEPRLPYCITKEIDVDLRSNQSSSSEKAASMATTFMRMEIDRRPSESDTVATGVFVQSHQASTFYSILANCSSWPEFQTLPSVSSSDMPQVCLHWVFLYAQADFVSLVCFFSFFNI